MSMNFDASDFLGKMGAIAAGVNPTALQATRDMADALIVFSTAEVPHHLGGLQKSGHPVVESDGTSVVYDIEYAAYQHEGGDGKRVIKNYQKGRKGKYLEDPLISNINTWRQIATDKMNKFLTH